MRDTLLFVASQVLVQGLILAPKNIASKIHHAKFSCSDWLSVVFLSGANTDRKISSEAKRNNSIYYFDTFFDYKV